MLDWILTTNQDGHFLVETDLNCVKCIQGQIHIATIGNVMLGLDCCEKVLSELSNCNSVRPLKDVKMLLQTNSFCYM